MPSHRKVVDKPVMADNIGINNATVMNVITPVHVFNSLSYLDMHSPMNEELEIMQPSMPAMPFHPITDGMKGSLLISVPKRAPTHSAMATPMHRKVVDKPTNAKSSSQLTLFATTPTHRKVPDKPPGSKSSTTPSSSSSMNMLLSTHTNGDGKGSYVTDNFTKTPIHRKVPDKPDNSSIPDGSTESHHSSSKYLVAYNATDRQIELDSTSCMYTPLLMGRCTRLHWIPFDERTPHYGGE
jgi:hypothetical protein